MKLKLISYTLFQFALFYELGGCAIRHPSINSSTVGPLRVVSSSDGQLRHRAGRGTKRLISSLGNNKSSFLPIKGSGHGKNKRSTRSESQSTPTETPSLTSQQYHQVLTPPVHDSAVFMSMAPRTAIGSGFQGSSTIQKDNIPSNRQTQRLVVERDAKRIGTALPLLPSSSSSDKDQPRTQDTSSSYIPPLDRTQQGLEVSQVVIDPTLGSKDSLIRVKRISLDTPEVSSIEDQVLESLYEFYNTLAIEAVFEKDAPQIQEDDDPKPSSLSSESEAKHSHLQHTIQIQSRANLFSHKLVQRVASTSSYDIFATTLWSKKDGKAIKYELKCYKSIKMFETELYAFKKLQALNPASSHILHPLVIYDLKGERLEIYSLPRGLTFYPVYNDPVVDPFKYVRAACFSSYDLSLREFLSKYRQNVPEVFILIISYKIFLCYEQISKANILHYHLRSEAILIRGVPEDLKRFEKPLRAWKNEELRLIYQMIDVKISDFERSIDLEKEKKVGHVYGLPCIQYSPPETLMGEPFEFLPTIDIWGLGMLLEELCLGYRHFAVYKNRDVSGYIRLIQYFTFYFGDKNPNLELLSSCEMATLSQYFGTIEDAIRSKSPKSKHYNVIIKCYKDNRFIRVIQRRFGIENPLLKLLEGCLKLIPKERLTIDQILKHPYYHILQEALKTT